MAQVKLTKNELKKQKDMLKRFQRYLPTLMLKKQQLQLVIMEVEARVKEREAAIKSVEEQLQAWIAVFGDEVGLENYLEIDKIDTGRGNIAGVDIPVFNSLTFKDIDYDLFLTPLWIDKGLAVLKEVAALKAEIEVLWEQRRLLANELRVTTQRVNLFEKVKIPETRTNIRKIQIYLGDQQTAAVVRGKISKKKLVEV